MKYSLPSLYKTARFLSVQMKATLFIREARTTITRRLWISSSLTLTFIENDLGLVSIALEDWKQLVQMPDELFNYSSLYKKIVFCDLLDNVNNVHTRYALTGVWPASASPTVLDYTSSDVWRISQEFSVDGGEVLPGIGRRAPIPRAVPIIGGL